MILKLLTVLMLIPSLCFGAASTEYDGSGDYRSLGTASGLNTFWTGGSTISIWAQPQTVGEGGFGMLWSRRNSNGWQAYCCNNNGGGFCAGVADTWTFLNLGASSTFGAWTSGASSISFN